MSALQLIYRSEIGGPVSLFGSPTGGLARLTGTLAPTLGAHADGVALRELFTGGDDGLTHIA